MSSNKGKVRIKDIAELAGVSVGTVDRVLHKRGEVSQASREMVEKVLAEINYSPNLIARSLASKKNYRFVCLIPEHSPTDYWQAVSQGFDLAAKEFLQYNIVLDKQYFNQFDSKSFVAVCNGICADMPDAVIVPPIFRDETLVFVRQLQEKEIPFSFIDSQIEGPEFLAYYGQNSFQSGYVAARLLLDGIQAGSQVLLVRTQRNGNTSNQTLARKNGFAKYIEDKKLSDIELINVVIEDKNDKVNMQILEETFEKNKNIKAAVTFNSKVYRMAAYLQALKQADVLLIGYDLLEQNVECLKQEQVSYLIAQRPDKQAYFAIRDLCTKLIFKQEIKNENYMPIDILMKENIDDYLHFNE